jgi:hypothetical protein
MGLHDHLSTYNTSYGWKKGQESKCQFDSWLLKVKNCFDLHVCKWRATYRWKAPDKGYNFSLDLTSIIQEVTILKNAMSPNFGNSRNFGIPNLGVLWQNDILVQPLWIIIENNIRKKSVASPKFGPWWVLWVRVCPCIKSVPTMH